MDEVRGSSRTIPNRYSSLLEAHVGGHALWRPQDSRQHGGELGDCGYVLDGHFWKLFNVYLDPPDGLQPLARPNIRDVKSTRVPNSSIFQSSRSSTVAFEASLPLTIPPISARFAGSVSATDSSFAFLACSGVYRHEDVLSRVESRRLQRYLCEHYSTLQRCGEGDVFIVRSTTKASGWIGGLATRGENDVSMSASFGIPGIGDFSVGMEHRVATGEITSGTASYINCDKTTGPLEWTVETPPVHPVILGVIRLRKRDRFRRALGIESAVLGKPKYVQYPPQVPTADGPGTSADQRHAKLDKEEQAASRPIESGRDRSHMNDMTYSTNSFSSISSDGMAGPSCALDRILDHFLDCNPGFDVAVGDSALLSRFVEQYHCEPQAGSVQFSWELEDGQGAVAFITCLWPLALHPNPEDSVPTIESSYLPPEGVTTLRQWGASPRNGGRDSPVQYVARLFHSVPSLFGKVFRRLKLFNQHDNSTPGPMDQTRKALIISCTYRNSWTPGEESVRSDAAAYGRDNNMAPPIRRRMLPRSDTEGRQLKTLLEEKYHFPDVTFISDGEQTDGVVPTAKNIKAAISTLIAGASTGDELVFAFIGLGGQDEGERDSSQEPEQFILAADPDEKMARIVDQELHELLVDKLPPGCRLTAIIDVAHSGTVLDLSSPDRGSGIAPIHLMSRNGAEEVAHDKPCPKPKTLAQPGGRTGSTARSSDVQPALPLLADLQSKLPTAKIWFSVPSLNKPLSIVGSRDVGFTPAKVPPQTV